MLNQGDNKDFVDLAEQVLQILRSEKVIPIKRLSENHYLHLLFAGMIVTTYLTQDDIYMSSRRSNVFVERSVSTRYIQFLDAAVRAKLLSSDRDFTAEGRLRLSGALLSYLEVSRPPILQSNVVELHQSELVN
tara:strand:+ start:49 stop:447 length:399 start_codon:yes stop_codon:yes gene_type:complete